jgi:hypothetical protein
MLSPSRRNERRHDVIDMLKHRYRVQDVIDYSGLEQDGVYLEETGAMVLNHLEGCRLCHPIEAYQRSRA